MKLLWSCPVCEAENCADYCPQDKNESCFKCEAKVVLDPPKEIEVDVYERP